MKRALAFDFGASSGRAILGEYEDGRLTYKEVHRFDNNPREWDGHFRWNFADLMANVRLGIEKAGAFNSIAFDTWGVDFGLLDEEGNLLEDPVHYRDSRTDGMTEQAEKILPAADLYAATGCQIMGINTLFQLLAVQKQQPELWAKARQLLFMPDLFAYALCGARACETTIASTSQMLDARTGSWNKNVLDAFSVPVRLLEPAVPSGTVVGDYKGAKVIAAAGHDTQCAVAALPAPQPGAAFLSCGTWSLLGCELDEPILTEESRTLALSNERGANGKVNYLKNIIGLWLIQESRRQWKREGTAYSFSELEELALQGRTPAQLHRPGRPGVHPARRHSRPRAGILPPHRPAGARNGGAGGALPLREPGPQIPLCPGTTGPRHRTEVLLPAHHRWRHSGQAALPHDRRQHRPAGNHRSRRSHRPRQHPHSAGGPGRTEKSGRGPRPHRPHRAGAAV